MLCPYLTRVFSHLFQCELLSPLCVRAYLSHLSHPLSHQVSLTVFTCKRACQSQNIKPPRLMQASAWCVPARGILPDQQLAHRLGVKVRVIVLWGGVLSRLLTGTRDVCVWLNYTTLEYSWRLPTTWSLLTTLYCSVRLMYTLLYGGTDQSQLTASQRRAQTVFRLNDR